MFIPLSICISKDPGKLEKEQHGSTDIHTPEGYSSFLNDHVIQGAQIFIITFPIVPLTYLLTG